MAFSALGRELRREFINVSCLLLFWLSVILIGWRLGLVVPRSLRGGGNKLGWGTRGVDLPVGAVLVGG